jgi:hypothetical protein
MVQCKGGKEHRGRESLGKGLGTDGDNVGSNMGGRGEGEGRE